MLNSNLIIFNPDADGKNNLNELEKKIRIISELKTKNIYPNSKKIINFGGEYLITDNDKFLKYLIKKFDYIVVETNNNVIIKELNNNFKLYKEFNSENIIFARSLTNKLRSKEKINDIKNIGSSLLVYKLDKF